MLLNEPTPQQTRPGTATATAAAASTRELPAVEGVEAVEAVDRAAAPTRGGGSAEAETVAFAPVTVADTGADDGAGASDGAGSSDGADLRNGADEPGGGGASPGRETDASVDSDTSTEAVSDVETEDQRMKAEAPTVGIELVRVDSNAIETVALDVDAVNRAVAESSPDATPTVSLSVTAVKQAIAEETAVGDTATVEAPTASYLVSTDLSTPASTTVAVPETADDVIATIHAAATAVAAADRRARQAAVVKDDPWTGLDLHRPAVPAPVDHVRDLLAPVLERPLLVVEQPGPPEPADVVALHRSELEVDFVEPPVVAAGAEPPIPPRYGPGLSVLPHIEFPV
jgi:hypothetical protein